MLNSLDTFDGRVLALDGALYGRAAAGALSVPREAGNRAERRGSEAAAAAGGGRHRADAARGVGGRGGAGERRGGDGDGDGEASAGHGGAIRDGDGRGSPRRNGRKGKVGAPGACVVGCGRRGRCGGGIRDTGGEREEREACHVAMWGKLRSGG